MNRINPAVRFLIVIISIINIICMMMFEYGLPSLVKAASHESSETASSAQPQDSSEGGGTVGTIEAVQQEEANKETEAAETALAKSEEDEEIPESDEEERDPDAPVLELTDDHIYLSVGDRFNYMSYIKTMEDVDGSDLSHYIHLDRDVDTSEPGEIELTYRITSTITGKSASRVLLITIR